ncbi:hypothetical protein [Haloferax sp. DFSO52]|uniref:hypothetical protein n=1 Tax=Haloferax sp. DFSO52 TaxID=3388505 RepID=UPI003A853FD9
MPAYNLWIRDHGGDTGLADVLEQYLPNLGYSRVRKLVEERAVFDHQWFADEDTRGAAEELCEEYDDARIALVPVIELSGRVESADTGEPIAGHLIVSADSGNVSRSVAEITVDATGEFAISDILTQLIEQRVIGYRQPRPPHLSFEFSRSNEAVELEYDPIDLVQVFDWDSHFFWDGDNLENPTTENITVVLAAAVETERNETQERYQLSINPVAEGIEQVSAVLRRMAVSEARIDSLLSSGGVIRESLNHNEGERWRDELMQGGAEATLTRIESEENERFVVSGIALDENGERLSDVTVRAYDLDLRGEELLGEERPNEEGEFEISYTPAQFARAEKDRADLVFRVLDRTGRELTLAGNPDGDNERVIYNADEEVEVELTVLEAVSAEETERSEYERLVEELGPVVVGVDYADFSRKDVEFLSHETDIDPNRIHALRVSALVEQETTISKVLIYGLIRVDDDGSFNIRGLEIIPFEETDDLVGVVDEAVTALGELELQEFERGVETAIDAGFIPEGVLEGDEELSQQFRRGRTEARISERGELRGTLRNAETGAVLVGYTVTLTPIAYLNRPTELLLGTHDLFDDSPESVETTVDQNGQVTVQYALLSNTDSVQEVGLSVRTPTGDILEEEAVAIDFAESPTFDVELSIPKPGAVGLETTELRAATEQSGLAPDEIDRFEEITGYLRDEFEIEDLVSIRAAGGVAAVFDEADDPPVPPEHPLVQVLDAHADLSVLSADLSRNAILIERNFLSPLNIAETSPTVFLEAMVDDDGFEQMEALRLHYAARAQKRVFDNILAGRLADRANNLAVGYEEVS